MRLIPWLAYSIIPYVYSVNANVEKVIFTAPPPLAIPNARPTLDELRLEILSPIARNILETRLPVAFPTHTEPRGLESWYLLQELEEGGRYEVRICWAATQPTSFLLDTYAVTQVFDTPDLISSLASYSEQRQDIVPDVNDLTPEEASSAPLLFLRIQAAADFYSSNRTLMESPPPVIVDIILDPYLFNILPRSLGPTVVYIAFLAVASYFIAGYIYRFLRSIADEPEPKPHTD